MSIHFQNLKDSNQFLNLLFENITSAVFLIDHDFIVQKVNRSFEILFCRKREEIIDQLCGEVLGCQFTVDSGQACGSTIHCKYCELRIAAISAYQDGIDAYKHSLDREFVIDKKRFKKYFLFSVKKLFYEELPFVLLIVDDFTDLEQKKLEVEEKNHEIIDSINYAFNIQKIALPSKIEFEKAFTDYFLLFKPRDVVSGDFYWIYKKNDLVFFTVADCTGHGVPGAMMSIMGLNFLCDIIQNQGIYDVDEVLNILRKKVISALKQQGKSGEQKDGMDMVLCSIHKASKILTIAGANNSCFILAKNEIETCNSLNLALSQKKNYLYEPKGDKMPVGIHYNMSAFKKCTIKLKRGNKVYLLTDGYQDQFGGELNKKFKSKNLKQLILQNSHLKMKDQKAILEDTLEKWRTTSDNLQAQTDDITVLGICI